MNRPVAPHRSRIAVALVCAAVAACAADPVALDVRPATAPAARKIAQPVAFLHTKAFREDIRTVEPYGNKYYLPLKTGEASDRALRSAYAQVFDAPREIGSLDELRAPGPPAPVAVIEPAIVRLDYLNASGRTWGPYYTEIVYRFALYDGAGVRLADWQVSGFGVYDMNLKPSDPGGAEAVSVLRGGETAWMSEAPRRAVEAATANFVLGFERVPELIRLARNQPLAGADVPAARQSTRETAPALPGIEASYTGAFALQVERAVVPQPPKELVKDEPPAPYLLPVRLTLRNQGAHRFALDPADAQWLPDGTPEGSPTTVYPLPAPVVSALIAGRPFGMVVGVMSPGVGMLPALFAALVSAAENERQKKDLAAWSAAINRDLLGAGVVPAGASRGGVIYFPRPPKLDGGTLVITVIDLDDALRYTVRVPLPAK